MLLAVDPGISTGWALFDRSQLHACGCGEPPTDYPGLLCFIVEKPQVYPGTPPGKANDLITLAWGAGGYFALAGRNPTVNERIMVKPHTWKGDVPKHIHHARIWNKLGPSERVAAEAGCPGMPSYLTRCQEVTMRKRKSIPDTAHKDVMDAIGLGLYAVNRLRP